MKREFDNPLRQFVQDFYVPDARYDYLGRVASRDEDAIFVLVDREWLAALQAQARDLHPEFSQEPNR